MTNWITWAYNWYVQRWPWANVGFQTWGHNLRRGFVWDNDCFIDNQLAHPYHGSMYHNAARASGYGFWPSFPFVAAGSASWELFGENINASLNDLINTTMGGMALGEVTFRLSGLLRGGRDGRPGGLGRQLGAFVASPIAETQSLISGQPEPTVSLKGAAADLTTISVGRHTGHPFVDVAVQFGSPFAADLSRPYDAFEFRIQVSPTTGSVIQHVGISGLLRRHHLVESPQNQLVAGLYQHYDYHDLPGIKLSGHSVSVALLYRRQLGLRHQLNLNAHAEGVILGAISSDHDFYVRRDFDLGPGAGARLGAAVARNGREWLRLDGRVLWLHTIHGSRANHLASFVRLGATVPMVRGMGLGGDVALTTRHSIYHDFPSVTKRVPQIRAFLTWAPS